MGELASGRLAVRALRRAGVEQLFTVADGDLFPLYDGCRREGMRIVDTRHEQTAAFAAEAMAKLTRRPQVAALSGGRGVIDALSAIATAAAGGSPLTVVAGRAPQATVGSGNLRESDPQAVAEALVKHAATATEPAGVAPAVAAALRAAGTAHRGPALVDIPADVMAARADEATVADPPPPGPVEVDLDAVAAAAAELRRAERPLLVAGSDVWLGGAFAALRDLVDAAGLPVVLDGMGRGCLPADHDLVVSRARGAALSGADLVTVVGMPLDFRVPVDRFDHARVVHVADHPGLLAAGQVELAAGVAGDLAAALTTLAEAVGEATGKRRAWSEQLRDAEAAARAADATLLQSDAAPIHPARVCGELRRLLDRDAVVIGDGDDLMSFVGCYVDAYTPGCWLDPGPFGCRGTGMGYAAAARLAHPRRQVVAVLGDGGAARGLMDAETLVRHRLPALIVVGNNGIRGPERQRRRQRDDDGDAADRQPRLRYDDVLSALGGAGETVQRPSDLAPAFERGLAAGVPYLVNVLTDPAVGFTDPRPPAAAARPPSP